MRRSQVAESRRQGMRDRQDRIGRYLAENPASGTVDVARALHLSPSTTRNDLAALEKAGDVERYNSEFGGGYVWHAL